MDITRGATLHDPEDDMHRVMTHGPAFGIPFVFVFTALLGLMAGSSLFNAGMLALVPALVGGPYFGGLAVLLYSRVKEEAAAAEVEHPRRHHFRGMRVGHV